ncbi:MAG: hypothetical protein VKO21_03525 [Candidatus Sericytochromatia bacterium]|nr:hypothetical protein [Candidatus Sericytochromatia bacterium]
MRRAAVWAGVMLLALSEPAWGILVQDPPAAAPEGDSAWELRGAWSDFYETLEDGVVKARCTPGLPEADCPFVESRTAWALEWRGRWSLGEGSGFEFHVPGTFVLQHDSGARLPPGLTPTALGFGDVRLVLARDLMQERDRSLVARLRANLPPNPSPMGLEPVNCVLRDGQGQVVTGPDGNEVRVASRLEWAAPSVDLRATGLQDLLDRDLQLVGTLGVNVPFRRQLTESLVQWRGLAFEGAAGLTWRPLSVAALHLEALGTWSNPFEEDRRIVCQTGYQRLDLTPGLSFSLFDGVEVWLLARLPVLQGGYWRDWAVVDFLAGVRSSNWQP